MDSQSGLDNFYCPGCGAKGRSAAYRHGSRQCRSRKRPSPPVLDSLLPKGDRRRKDISGNDMSQGTSLFSNSRPAGPTMSPVRDDTDATHDLNSNPSEEAFPPNAHTHVDNAYLDGDPGPDAHASAVGEAGLHDMGDLFNHLSFGEHVQPDPGPGDEDCVSEPDEGGIDRSGLLDQLLGLMVECGLDTEDDMDEYDMHPDLPLGEEGDPGEDQQSEQGTSLLAEYGRSLMGSENQGGVDSGNAQSSSSRNVQFYIANIHAPLYSGSSMTVLEYTYAVLTEKAHSKLTDTSIDRWLRLHASVVLPAGNLCPPSLYIARQLVGCKLAAELERHVCVKDHYLFPNLPRSEYRQHLHECCPLCQVSMHNSLPAVVSTSQQRVRVHQEPRFKLTKAGTIVPVKTFWYLGVKNAITELFSQKEWAGKRGTSRTTPGDYYRSVEARRVHDYLEPLGCEFLSDKGTSAYELGLDWCQVFTGKTHSVGIVGVR